MDRTASQLCDGIYFGEGPRWKDGRIWFSDFYARAVKSASPKGDVRVEVEIDDQPSGIGWTPDGSLLIVSMVKRQVLRRTPDGKISVHADLSKIASFHCNDMIVDSTGGAYVGNFGFDLHEDLDKRGDAAVIADHPTAKLARISPSGAVSVAAEGMHFPNGCVITPDGKTLIVAETLGGRLTAFAIGLDGNSEWPSRFCGNLAARARRDRAGCERGCLDCECVNARMRPDWRGRDGARYGRHKPELLRLYAGRRRRPDTFHDDRTHFSRERGGLITQRTCRGSDGRVATRGAALDAFAMTSSGYSVAHRFGARPQEGEDLSDACRWAA